MQKTPQMRTCKNRALTALVSESEMHQGDISHHGAAAPEEPETDVVRLELITL